MLGHVEDESRFSHRRTGRDQDQVRGLKTGGLVVQIDKTGGNTRDGSLVFGSFLDLIQGI